jgi:hypothetical protein
MSILVGLSVVLVPRLLVLNSNCIKPHLPQINLKIPKEAKAQPPNQPEPKLSKQLVYHANKSSDLAINQSNKQSI